MEAKLKEYRALRRRKELIDNAKEKFETTKQKVADLLVPNIFKDMAKEKSEDEVLLLEDEKPTPKKPLIQPEETYEMDETEEQEEEPDDDSGESWTYVFVKWTIYTVIWLSLFLYFVKLGFGAVFFAFSALFGICLNTRTRRRRPGEASAYSVFNRGCESIDGTVRAEDLQRQMFFGIGGLRLF